MMKLIYAFILSIGTIISLPIAAETEDQAISRKLANPISNLIQLPVDFTYDSNLGSDDEGERTVMTIKPVIPFSISENWNVISRTVLPIVSLTDVVPGSSSETGLGDTVQSFFISPKTVGDSGWIWGAGPVFIVPTSNNDFTGLGEPGAGLTAVALRQKGKSWTYGALVNSIRDVNSDTPIKTTLTQPFISYRTPSSISLSMNSEATYDDINEEWSIPIKFSASKLFRFGKLPVSLGGGLRYWAEGPSSGPEGWGLIATINIILPK
ncbi:MAG: transporter [Saccharospirillaceae bacterium]|nr:hypothetical protein A3759_15720 [Thalassolituus sp. HI0120]MCH2041062.1 transporter [Saccharospirillaceae bacterium]